MTDGNFGSAVKWNIFGSAARVAVTVLCQIVLLRILGPIVAGQFAIFLVVVGIGSILSEGGMMVALTRSEQLTRDVSRGAISLIILYASLIVTVLLFSNELLAKVFHLPADLWYLPACATFNVLPLGLSSVPLSILRRQYRSREVQIVQLFGYVIGFAFVAVPLAIILKNVDAFIIGFTVQSFLTMFCAFYISKSPVIPGYKAIGGLFKVSSRALGVNLFFFFNESVANIFTAHFVGTRSVGLYGTALNLLRMPVDVIVNSLHSPLLVSTSRDGGSGETRARFLSTLNVLVVLILPGLAVVFFTKGLVIVPLLGAKWIDAAPVLSVLSLAMMLRMLSMLCGAIVWGKGHLTFDLFAQISSILIFVSTFFIVRPSSAVEVAWLVSISMLVRFIAQLILALRVCAIGLPDFVGAFVIPGTVSLVAMSPIIILSEGVNFGGNIILLAPLAVEIIVLYMVRVAFAVFFAKRFLWSISARRFVPSVVAP